MSELKKLLDQLSVDELRQLMALKQNGKQLAKLEQRREGLLAQLAEVENRMAELGLAPEAEAAPVKGRQGRKSARPAKVKIIGVVERKRGRAARKADVLSGEDAPVRGGRKPRKVVEASKPGRRGAAAKAEKAPKTRRGRQAAAANGGITLQQAILDILAASKAPEGLGVTEIIQELAARGYQSNANLASLKKMILSAIAATGGQIARASRGRYCLA